MSECKKSRRELEKGNSCPEKAVFYRNDGENGIRKVRVYVDITAPNPRTTFANLGELVLHPKYKDYGLVGDEDIPEVRKNMKYWDKVIDQLGVACPVFAKVDWADGKGARDGVKVADIENMQRRLSIHPKSMEHGYEKLGVISVTPQKIRKLFEIRRISDRMRQDVLNVLQAEVEMYSAWLNREVYGYQVIAADGEILDADDNYYGDLSSNGLLQAAGLSEDEITEEFRVKDVQMPHDLVYKEGMEPPAEEELGEDVEPIGTPGTM